MTDPTPAVSSGPATPEPAMPEPAMPATDAPATDAPATDAPGTDAPASGESALPQTEGRKGPLSFLSGALTAGLLAWLSLGLSRRLAVYYALHPPRYSSAIAQSIATALKTLIVGMAFLATFSFAFIALGLSLVLVRSLVAGPTPAADGDGEAT